MLIESFTVCRHYSEAFELPEIGNFVFETIAKECFSRNVIAVYCNKIQLEKLFEFNEYMKSSYCLFSITISTTTQ